MSLMIAPGRELATAPGALGTGQLTPHRSSEIPRFHRDQEDEVAAELVVNADSLQSESNASP